MPGSKWGNSKKIAIEGKEERSKLKKDRAPLWPVTEAKTGLDFIK